MLAVSSIAIMVVTLTVVLGLFFSQAILDATLKTIESRVDVTIYLSETISEDTIFSMQKDLESMPEIRDVTYISKEEALALFRERHANDNLTLQALEEVELNPLSPSFVIHAKDTSHYEGIMSYFEDNSKFIEENKTFITKVNFNRNREIINRILVLRDGVKSFGLVLTFIFIIIAVLVTFNTVKLSTFSMKDEIDIMRLIGAKGALVRGPFIVAQILYGIVASVITLVLFLFITYYLNNSLVVFFGINLFEYYIRNIVQIAGLILGSAIILGIASSYIAVSKYLKK